MMKDYASKLLILAALAIFAFTPTAGASSLALTPGVVASNSVLNGCADSQPECEDCCEHYECCCDQDGGVTTGSCDFWWTSGPPEQSTCSMPGCFGGSGNCDLCDPI
jgi:hypothetical protein